MPANTNRPPDWPNGQINVPYTLDELRETIKGESTMNRYCDGCKKIVAMVYPVFSGDNVWQPFTLPTASWPHHFKTAFCSECKEPLGDYSTPGTPGGPQL